MYESTLKSRADYISVNLLVKYVTKKFIQHLFIRDIFRNLQSVS